MTEDIKLIPYGLTDFKRIRTQNYYYVDKTCFIAQMERMASYILFMRPRRFGKSLFCNVLSAYYDVKMASDYDAIFSGTYIHQHPTKEHNTYMVMKFNFSAVNAEPESVEQSFANEVLISLRNFASRYAHLLPQGTAETLDSTHNWELAMSYIYGQVKKSDYRIYLIIDEYDNFCNTLLSYDEAGYEKLTHGTGFLRLFFNLLKAATTDNEPAISRLFITGVTPLTLSDVTSGFNIGMNISMHPLFNETVGFTEGEVRDMIDYYRSLMGNFSHTTDELLACMRPFYNNSCFSKQSLDGERIYNTDMVLYFVSQYTTTGSIPERMVDMNVTSDMNKVRKMLGIGHDTHADRNLIIEKILNDGYINADVIPEFKLADLGKKDSLVSLMFYLGLLSYGRDAEGYPTLVITNQVVREQYYSYLKNYYSQVIGWHTDMNVLQTLGLEASRKGNVLPLLEYICQQMSEQSSNRDFNREGESFVKGYVIATIGNNNSYFACRTEQELNHGYCDIIMRPQQDGLHAYLVELKYLKPSAKEQEVEKCFDDARVQLQAYAKGHPFIDECTRNHWSPHTIALVVKGWQIAKLEEICWR